MINYSSITNVLCSDKYVDISQCFEQFWEYRYRTITNCRGTGSSLLLKTFACFLDKDADTKEVFHNLAIGKSEDFSRYVNSYRVLYLDFSDFDAKDYRQAINYIRHTMSDVYKFFFTHFEPKSDYLYDFRVFEKALDIIEGESSVKVLQSSLHNLVLQLRGYERYNSDNRLAVLIDNLIRLETVAEQYGYADEMNKFLTSFIVEDVYKYCDIFLQISDQEEKRDSWFVTDRHLVYRYFCVLDFDVRERCPEMVVPPERQSQFDVLPYSLPEYDWKTCIADGRKRVQQAIHKEEQRRLAHIRNEKKRFAEDLSADIPLFSPNMGIRKKQFDKSLSRYTELNALLKDIYLKHQPKFLKDDIYSYFQKLNEDDRIVNHIHHLIEILDNLPKLYSGWDSGNWAQCTGCWVQTIYGKKGSDGRMPGKPDNIKVYACFNHADIQDIFIDSLKYLLQNADDTFAAKIATFNRADQMCYWLSKSDFVHLEDFFRPYFGNMAKSLPFVAYKGMLGISREFPGWDDSHNATQAHIIADYLKTVIDAADIDLEEMYNHYIAKWNADIYEESDYSGFKNSSALSLIVILDTIDTILSDSEISEDSLLLSGDTRIWGILSDSRCWADVNEKWQAQNCI